jgi:hypothetical protein
MDYWHISRYADEVATEDIVFIWHAGVGRGIYDVAKVRSVPPHRPEARRQIDILKRDDDRFWADTYERDRLRQLPTVLIERQYVGKVEPPVLVDELKQNGFGSLPIIAMAQRGIYRVEQTIGERLLDYIRWKLSHPILPTSFIEDDSMPTYSKSDIQRMVDKAAGESRHKVNLDAKQILVNTGLEGKQHLQEQYQHGRIKEIEIQRGLTTLLHAAMEIAKSKKKEEIDESDVIEAMRSKCPIKPWC